VGISVKIIASLVLYRHDLSDIQNTLNSLLEEECIDKVCIVDNGSHCHWLNDFNHVKIDIIKLEGNIGFGGGHNAAFEKCSQLYDYDFMLVCNPDIYFDSGEVYKLYSFSVKNGTGLSIPKVIYPDGRLQYSCKLLPRPMQLLLRRFFPSVSQRINYKYELREADYEKAFFAPSLSGCFMLLSKEAIEITSGFDQQFFMYLEDVDLSRRVCIKSLKVSYCPYSTVVHESQRGSYRNIKLLYYHICSAFRYFNKWGWFSDISGDELNKRCLSNLPIKK